MKGDSSSRKGLNWILEESSPVKSFRSEMSHPKWKNAKSSWRLEKGRKHKGKQMKIIERVRERERVRTRTRKEENEKEVEIETRKETEKCENSNSQSSKVFKERKFPKQQSPQGDRKFLK